MSAETSDLHDLAQRRATGFDGVMAFEIVRADRDQVIVEYTVDEQHLQPYGIVHGGVHAGMIETLASAGAALSAVARGQTVVGLENSTSFIRAVRGGKLRATSTPITRGRRTQVWQTTIVDDADRVVATGRVRLLCLDPGAELAGETAAVKA